MEDSPEEQVLWAKTSVIVRTNRERCSINYNRALLYAKLTNVHMFRWLTQEGKWEGKPLDEDNVNEIIETDSAFWEIFVEGGPCYLTDTISKRRKLCNGTRATYHSLLLDEEQIHDFQTQDSQGKTLITLHRPPLGINIRIDNTHITKADHWKEFRIEPAAAEGTTTNTTSNKRTTPPPIIVPIRPGCNNDRDNKLFVKSPSPLIRPSRVSFNSIYPLRGAFAITVDKAQGQTLERVIIALSKREHQLSNFDYACVYVATSRVHQTHHQRLLLKEMANVGQQWLTLTYLTSKKQCKSIPAFFSGFQKDRNNWTMDKWNRTKASDNFE